MPFQVQNWTDIIQKMKTIKTRKNKPPFLPQFDTKKRKMRLLITVVSFRELVSNHAIYHAPTRLIISTKFPLDIINRFLSIVNIPSATV